MPINDINAFKNADPLLGLQSQRHHLRADAGNRPGPRLDEIPKKAQQMIVKKNIRVLFVDTARIAREECSVPDLIVRMQGVVLVGIFLADTPFADEKGLSG